MINVTFPDNNIKQFQKGITSAEIALSISKTLANNAIAAKINNELKDLDLPINQDCFLQILTIKDHESLEVIRHDAAHILAQAVKELFPETEITIGPVIENGFYYDFAREKAFVMEDLAKIEEKMRQISSQNIKIQREVWNRNEAISLFKNMNENYKAEIIASIPEEQEITLYRQGNFIDLCRGPHSPSTGKIKYFRLTKLAGAYWRGDSKNPMLQRIYGTAWATGEQLEKYLHMIEEAEKRDHRKIGKQLSLFHFQEEAQGMVFWHNKGLIIYNIIENYIRNKIKKAGYLEVKTPILYDKSLWEASGHWAKFRDNMFSCLLDDKILALKPMNCPAHVQIYKQNIKSYRDLPLRISEFGLCHRSESSGALHGLMRVRSFTQDDAHIFCRQEQIIDETINFCNLLKEVYKDFGFTEIKVKFSDRPEVRAGSNEVWDKAEKALKEGAIASGLEYSINSGEGAFYGPKLEFILTDAIGRQWQCGTFQVDFILPENLDAEYIDEEGKKQRPVMLHRAIIGTLERFIGILIEQYAGKFPLWLAPVQVGIVTITNACDSYAKEVYDILLQHNIRAIIDITAEKVNYKLRNMLVQKIPLIAVIGKKEMEDKTLNIRKIGQEDSEIYKLDDLIRLICNENKILL